MFFKRPQEIDIGTQPPAATPNPHRKTDRHAATGITTSIGDVVDLSSVGVRLTLNAAPPSVGDRVCVTIDINSTIYAATVEVVWTRMCGFFKFEAGCVFIEPSTELNEALQKLTTPAPMKKAA